MQDLSFKNVANKHSKLMPLCMPGWYQHAVLSALLVCVGASTNAGFTAVGPKPAFTPCLSALCRETWASTSVRHMCSTPRTALHWTCLWWMAGTTRWGNRGFGAFQPFTDQAGPFLGKHDGFISIWPFTLALQAAGVLHIVCLV